jgi:hypothetical protein
MSWHRRDTLHALLMTYCDNLLYDHGQKVAFATVGAIVANVTCLADKT